jgi:adenylate cyclase
LKEKLITPGQLEKALTRQLTHPLPLGRTVVEMGLAGDDEVLEAINRHYRIGALSLEENVAGLIRSRAHFRRSLARLRTLTRFKLSIVVVCVVWATILALSLVMLARQRAQLTGQALRMGLQSLAFATEQAKVPWLDGNRLQLNRIVKAATAGEGVSYGLITDPAGQVRAHSDPRRIGTGYTVPAATGGPTRLDDVTYFSYVGEEGAQLLHLSRPLRFQNKVLGQVHLGVSLDFIGASLRRDGLLMLALSLLVIAFGIVLAFALGGNLLRPISSLLAAARGEVPSARQFQVRIRPRHEFEDLAAAFDQISHELGRKVMMEKSFGRYVNPSVLDLILANPEQHWLRGTRAEASVLLADVRGFTPIVERKEPEEVVEALNEYLAIASRAIQGAGGYVDKFIGDAVLGVFGVPAHDPEHPLAAVKAAVAMQKELRRRSRNNPNPLLDKVAIGISCGVVVSGNIGSEEKMEYAVIGDTVNLASRLCDLAASGEIILDESVVERLPRHLVTLRELAPRKVKGKEAPVAAFKLLKTEF